MMDIYGYPYVPSSQMTVAAGQSIVVGPVGAAQSDGPHFSAGLRFELDVLICLRAAPAIACIYTNT